VGLFDRLRDQLDQVLARATVPPTPREVAAQLEQSLIDTKVGLDDLRRAAELSRGAPPMAAEAHTAGLLARAGRLYDRATRGDER